MAVKMKSIAHNKIVLFVLVVLAAILCCLLLKLYFSRLDIEERKIQSRADLIYVTKDNKINDEGLYVANLKDELEEVFEDQNIKSVIYKFDGEEFYLEVSVEHLEDGDLDIMIDKIVNPKFNINARMNMRNVESIEYRTGNPQESSVLKIDQTYNSNYFAMTDGAYYFLGQDIESISFREDRFYYLSYNPDYLTLKDAKTCSKEIKNAIDGFSMKDYYYKYGKINFLRDYYQKLSSTKFTVQERCDELENINSNNSLNE